MTNHALRTLVKKDSKPALEFLGYPAKPNFTLSDVSASSTVKIGQALEYKALVISGKKQKLKIFLRVHFRKANGQYSSKVFVVKDMEMKKNAELSIVKNLTIRPMTTKALYLGTHYVEIVVNGVAKQKMSFELIE